MLVDRDPSTIVADSNTAVGKDCYVNPGAVAGHGFVYSVVYDLPDEVVEPCRARRADVHTWSDTHRLKTLENGDIACSVASGPLTFLGHRGILSVEIQAFWRRHQVILGPHNPTREGVTFARVLGP